MNKLIDLIIFIVVLAVLWWALTTVLSALALPAAIETVATVLFVVVAVFAAIDYFRSGTWFWSRR